MTRAEVMELLDKLELSSHMDDYEVRDRLEDLGYRRSQISVYDGATKICLVFEKTDFIVSGLITVMTRTVKALKNVVYMPVQ